MRTLRFGRQQRNIGSIITFTGDCLLGFCRFADGRNLPDFFLRNASIGMQDVEVGVQDEYAVFTDRSSPGDSPPYGFDMLSDPRRSCVPPLVIACFILALFLRCSVDLSRSSRGKCALAGTSCGGHGIAIPCK